MEKHKKRLIIQNGNVLRKLAEKPGHGFSPKPLLRELDEAQAYLTQEIDQVIEEFSASSSQDFLSDIFVSFEMPQAYLAKSYEINTLYRDAGFERVATNSWRDKEKQSGKMDIVRGPANQLVKIKQVIQNVTKKGLGNELRRIDGIQLTPPMMHLTTEERSMFELAFYRVSQLSELQRRLSTILETPISEDDFLKEGNMLYLSIKASNQQVKRLQSNKLKGFSPLMHYVLLMTLVNEN